MIKTHVHVSFGTDLHEVSWHFSIHFATHEAVRPGWFKVQPAEWRSVSKNPFKMGFCFHLTLEKQIRPLDPLKSVSKVGDLSSTIAVNAHCFGAFSQVRAIGHWLVKSVTYFDLIAYIGGCGREFQCSKYNLSSHPKTLEITGKCGIIPVSCCEQGPPWIATVHFSNSAMATMILFTYMAQIAPISFQTSMPHKPYQVRWGEVHDSVVIELPSACLNKLLSRGHQAGK